MAASFLLLIGAFMVSNSLGNQLTDSNSRTGYGFYLPKRDMLGIFTGGARIFSDVDTNCIITTPRNKHQKNTAFYRDTQTFFSSIATQTGLSVSLKMVFSMGFTFNAKSKSISSSNYDASGASLYMYSYLKDEVLSSDCQNNMALDSKFKAAFEALPLEVANPHYRSSWSDYETFLETFGSHFVSTTHFGALVEQYNFAKSEKHYSQKEFEARVCGDFLGPTEVGLLNVTSCFGIDKSKINGASSLDMSSQFTVLGGTSAARTALLLDRSTENVRAFLETATDENAFAYQFTAVWNLLKSKYIGTSHYGKALNLQHFLTGYLGHRCNYRKDSQSGYVLKQFMTAEDHTPEIPSYKCDIPSQGCHSNNDCNIGGWGTVCYCHGDTCVEYDQQQIAGKTITNPLIRHALKGSTKEGINQSCIYKLFSKCLCVNNWDGGPKTVWSSGMVIKNEYKV